MAERLPEFHWHLGSHRVLGLWLLLLLLYGGLQGLAFGLLNSKPLAVLLPAALGLVLFPIILLHLRGFAVKETLKFDRAPLPADLLWTAMAAVFAFLPSEWLGGLGIHIFGIPADHLTWMAELNPETTGAVILLGLGLVVFGPLGEEIVFRGLLQPTLRQELGRVASILICALLFAAIHLLPAYLLSLGFVGLLLSWLRERSDGLWLPWLAHSIYNLVILGMMLLLGPTDPSLSTEDLAAAEGIPGSMALASGALCLFALSRVSRR